MAGRTEYSEDKKFFLAKAIVFIFEYFGWISQEYREIPKEEWLMSISNIMPRPHLLKKYLKPQKEGPYEDTIILNGDDVSFYHMWRHINDLIKMKNWPEDCTLSRIVQFAFNKIVLTSAKYGFSSTPDEELIKNKVKEFLVRYKYYLETTNDSNANILLPWAYITDFDLPRPSYDMHVYPKEVSYTELTNYINNTIGYIKKYYSCCDSNEHKIIFDYFVSNLEVFNANIKKQYEEGNKKNFADTRNIIRQVAFATEAHLLRLSLINSNNMNIYFSDSGFADENSNVAVWCKDRGRQEVLRRLRECKEKNNSLKYHRILLLASKKVKDYNKHQLFQLSRDIICLLESYVTVYIGLKDHAKEVASDLFNIAIGENGIIMRASEDHSEWHIAKVPVNHPEYKDLLTKYKEMLHRHSTKMLKYDYSTYLEQKDWKQSTEEEKIEYFILPKLLNWMV